MKKYEFTGETKLLFGIELKRIKALVDIEGVCKAGELGGYIQSEENLSQSDNAWVCGNACVYGGARVYGNARVCDNAQVSDNAQVYGNARVYNNAWVCGKAQVCGGAWEKTPLYVQGTRYAAYMYDRRRFAVGCQRYTFEGWHKFWRRIADINNFTEEEQREYISYFNLACDLYGKPECKVSFEDESGNEEMDE